MGSMIPLSVLDLSPIVQGGDPGQSLRASRELGIGPTEKEALAFAVLAWALLVGASATVSAESVTLEDSTVFMCRRRGRLMWFRVES